MGFKYKHLWHSDAAVDGGISNYPGVDIESNPALTADYINNNLSLLYQNIISPLTNAFGPDNIFISSGYRCMLLNRSIGASPTSQHVYGLAVDLACSTHSSRDIFNWCIENLPNSWNQLIWEYPEKGNYTAGKSSFSWLHASWAQGYNLRKISVATTVESIHERYKEEDGTNRVGEYTHKINRAYNDIGI